MPELFQPELELACNEDGELVLHAQTLTPNGCFYAAGSEVSDPDGDCPPGYPKVQFGQGPSRAGEPPLKVDLFVDRSEQQICLQYFKPVKHRVNLGTRVDEDVVEAAVHLGEGETGKPIATSTIEVPDKNQCRREPVPLDTTDWQAYVRGPSGDPTLHVQGTVVLPHPGFETDLTTADNQPDDPESLALNLEVSEKDGAWPEVVTERTVEFEQFPASPQEVVVHTPSGDQIHVKVNHNPLRDSS